METFGLILFIVGLVGVLFTLGYSIYRSVLITKDINPNLINWDKSIRNCIYFGIGNALLVLISTIGVYLWKELNITAEEWAATIFGAIIGGAAFFTFINSFILHYYGKEVPVKLNKWLYRVMLISIPTFLVFLFIYTDGFANYLIYPLPNGISFTKGLIHGGGNITFYALCILSGAVFVYFLCDHKFYKQYGKHGIIESTFFVAFPAGIIGARIAYVIGQWEVEFAHREFWHVFAIWEGGLTILGGAIGGILVGVLWFVFRKKQYNIWLAVDIIVPTILLAQGIGRWGNFFNNEVHGIALSGEYFAWLPRIIYNNSVFSSSSSLSPLTDGRIFVPLFLIESIVNFVGYFVLSGLFGKYLRKYTELGDLAFGYLIWYGMTRVIMEPLRDAGFNMGKDGYWSWFWSLIFVAAGALAILGNHWIRYLIKQKKDEYVVSKQSFYRGLITFISFMVIAITLSVIGIVIMSTNKFSKTITLTGFNNGVILLVTGLSLLTIGFTQLPLITEGRKNFVKD